MTKSTPIIELPEEVVQRIAGILGDTSAAAKALVRGAELKAENVDVAYYQTGNTLLVGPRITEEEAEAPTPAEG